MSESIADTQTRLTEFITEINPQADLSPGSVLSELLIKLAATLQNNQYNTIETLLSYNSIQAAQASTTPTYNETIDQIASNFNVTRNPGATSTGTVQVFVTTLRGYTIPANLSFTQPSTGLTYTTTTATVIAVTPNTNFNELPIYTAGTGSYYFLLPVTATAVGNQYQISNGTTLAVTVVNSIPNFVSANAYGSFSSGLPEDTDQVLITKLTTKLNSSFVSPVGIQSAITAQYPGFQALSCIGANDPEMMRSKENSFGTSTFGMADLYVRTSVGQNVVTIVKTGTKISTGVWQINMLNTDAPGFYRVVSIIPTPASGVTVGGTLVVNSTDYGYALYPGQRNNTIYNANDARFTMYQTATIQFQYNEPAVLPPGSTASFTLQVSVMPNIENIQNLFLADTTRVLAADYLVRAVIPCFVSLNINIVPTSPTATAATLGVPTLLTNLFNYINTLPFGTSLAASQLIKICHQQSGIQYVDIPIQMTGQIYNLDGTTTSISSNDVLEIPTDLANGVSSSTCQYFCDYSVTTATGTSNVTNDSIAITIL